MPLIKLNIYEKCFKNIPNRKIGIEYDLAMRYTLDGAYNINCILYTNLVNGIMLIVFSTKRCQMKRMKNTFIARPPWVTVLNRTLLFTMFQEIPMEKYH